MTPLPCCGVPPVATDEGDGFTSLSCPVCGCYVVARWGVTARWNAYQRIGVDNE
jgi:hypothetical protein